MTVHLDHSVTFDDESTTRNKLRSYKLFCCSLFASYHFYHYIPHFLSFSSLSSFLAFTFNRGIVFPLSDLFLLHYISFLPSFLSSYLPSIHPSFFTLFFFLSIATKLFCFLVLSFRRLFFFSDAFAKLWKATISFVMSVHLSVLPSVRMEQPGSHRKNFHEIYYMSIFRESEEKNSNFL